LLARPCSNRDARCVLRKRQGDGAADAAATTRNQRSFSG
jgi:hypothetical protein